MKRLSWLALPMLLLLAGCPSGGGGGGSGEGSAAVIIYRADQTTDTVPELFDITSGTKLNPALALGKAVQAFAITPDKTAVVYIADQDLAGTREAYRVLFSAPGTAVKLNPTFAPARQAQEILVTPDSRSVVYRANQTAATAVELFRVFFTLPGSSTTLNGPLVSGGNVEAFAIR